MSVDKFYLKEVIFNYFFDYLALELYYTNDYKFSDLLDLVDDCYNNFATINLCYNSQDLFININNGELYYNIYINIKHKLFKNYKSMQHFINELEEYIDTTSNT